MKDIAKPLGFMGEPAVEADFLGSVVGSIHRTDDTVSVW